MNDALTFGVLGHVDHGKTALVRALTGMETDRLREERDRGLSIVLGFAFLGTANGAIDLIDAPGHEDFVRAMIAGATAIDGIILCVAANEGVMPQTAEHFNIARLLGVRKGLIVITKTDLVDAATLAPLRQALDEFVRGSFLEGAAVTEVSALSGAGVATVRDELGRIAETPVEREAGGRFFLPIDRVFTMRGFGVVATGTLRDGVIAAGDQVEILPSGRTATVRALQNHGRTIEQAVPGQRVAVNLRQAGRDDVERGDVLAAPGSIRPGRRIDVELRLLDGVTGAVRNGAVVRFLTGTTEAMARLSLLDRRELNPGQASIVQLSLDRDIATKASEHFLVRRLSPALTIGGGMILGVNSKRHRRFDAAVTERLETVATGDLDLIVRQRLEEAGSRGIDTGALAEDLGVGRNGLIARIGPDRVVDIGEHLVVARGAYAALLDEIAAVMDRFHREQPFRNGLDLGGLVDSLDLSPGPQVVRHALKSLVEQQRIRNSHEVYSLAGHDPFAGLGDDERRLVGEIERAFLECGLEPPSPETLVGGDRARQSVYRLLLESGRLVRLRTYKTSAALVLHATVLEDAKGVISRNFPPPAAFALKDIRDLLGSTRKYVVPLMEHLDATGTTVRNGDLRRLRQ